MPIKPSLSSKVIFGTTPLQLPFKSPKFSKIIRNKVLPRINQRAFNLDVFTAAGVDFNALLCLQALFGFRIGELLSLKRSALRYDGFIIVSGSKKSLTRIVYFPYLLQQDKYSALKPYENLFTLTYNQYYRLLNRFNIFGKPGKGRINNSVTHLFRHLVLKQFDNDSQVDFQSLKGFSGHKSNRGLQFYTNKAEHY